MAKRRKIVPKHEPEVARRKPGRPSGYLTQYVKIAQRLAYLGATDKDLAIAFDTSITAIERWCAKHAEFRGALKLGKNEADQRMQRSLYQRGVGYSYDAVKIFMPAGQARGPSHSCPTGAPSSVDYFKPLLPYHRTGQGRTPQGGTCQWIGIVGPLARPDDEARSGSRLDQESTWGGGRRVPRPARQAANERASEMRGVFETVSALRYGRPLRS